MHKKAPVILYIRLNYSAYMHIFEKTRINNPSKNTTFHFLPFLTRFYHFLTKIKQFPRFMKQKQRFISFFVAAITQEYTCKSKSLQ